MRQESENGSDYQLLKTPTISPILILLQYYFVFTYYTHRHNMYFNFSTLTTVEG